VKRIPKVYNFSIKSAGHAFETRNNNLLALRNQIWIQPWICGDQRIHRNIETRGNREECIAGLHNIHGTTALRRNRYG